MKQFTIHEALATLKLLDKRIAGRMRTNYVLANRKNNTKIDGRSLEDISVDLESNLQSVRQLMSNRRELKSAIAQSNSVTKIVVCGKEMTIVEAIEEKNFCETRKRWINEMKTSLKLAKDKANMMNEALPDAAERYIQSLFNASKDSKNLSDEAKTAREEYIKSNTWELLDPSKIADVIEAEEKAVEDFMNSIDFKLSESNALTKIEVNYVEV